jgi:hypothetical protein
MPNALAFLMYAPDAPISHKMRLPISVTELVEVPEIKSSVSIYNDNPCSVSKGSVGCGKLSTKKVMRITK